MIKVALLALGGALGTLARYFSTSFFVRDSKFPFIAGTLVVNISGSFLIGLLWGFLMFKGMSENVRVFLFIGFLGAYTTFSTFCLESFNLFRDGEFNTAFLNIALSNVLGLCFVFLGFFISRVLIGFLK